MLNTEQVNAIADEISRTYLGKRTVVRVMSEPTMDWVGKEALRVTIVIQPKSVRRLSGEQVVDTLYNLQRRLIEEGDERFPHIKYATPEELAEVADARS